MGVYYDTCIGYYWSFSKKDLKKVLNHVFNNLIVCGEDFDKSTEFHKKKIIKDVCYSNMFSFKNFGFGIFLKCEEQSCCGGKDCDNKECMMIKILITEITPFISLTKKEKIDFNNFLKYFKKSLIFKYPDEEKDIFGYNKNHDLLLKFDYGGFCNPGILAEDGNKLYDGFLEVILYFKSNEKELEKIFQNFFKDFGASSFFFNPGADEKIRIIKRFLKSSMRINFKFNKFPMYVRVFRYNKEDEFKNLETYFQIIFGFSFERDIREANEDRKKLFNKHFKKFKKFSNSIVFDERWGVKDYFKKTLFDENGFRIGGFQKN